MLVEHLPSESATQQKLAGPAAAWSVLEHLTALVFDALQAGNWQRGGGKGPKPHAIPRPGVDSGRTQSRIGTPHSIAEMRQILDTW